MANVRFFQSVLAGLVAATFIAGGVTGALLVRDLTSDATAHQPPYLVSEVQE